MDAIERRGTRRGTTLVEMAIVLPLLLGLTLAIIEYGWLFLNAQRITNIARQGARIAILPHGSAEDEAYDLIDRSLDAAGLSDDDPDRSVVTSSIPDDPDGRLEVTVTVTVSTAKLAFVGVPLWFGGQGRVSAPGHLSATVTMAKESP